MNRNYFPGEQFEKRSVCNTEQRNRDMKHYSIYVRVRNVQREVKKGRKTETSGEVERVRQQKQNLARCSNEKGHFHPLLNSDLTMLDTFPVNLCPL